MDVDEVSSERPREIRAFLYPPQYFFSIHQAESDPPIPHILF